jgi:hypothetical protein
MAARHLRGFLFVKDPSWPPGREVGGRVESRSRELSLYCSTAQAEWQK